MAKRWLEPVLCLLIAAYAFIITINYSFEGIDSIMWLEGQVLKVFGLVAVIGALVLVKYRKIAVPILIANGIWVLYINYINYSDMFVDWFSPLFILILAPPFNLPFWLIVVSIIALIRKPLPKEKVEEIKKKLE